MSIDIKDVLFENCKTVPKWIENRKKKRRRTNIYIRRCYKTFNNGEVKNQAQVSSYIILLISFLSQSS